MVLGNAAGTANPFRGQWGWIRPLWGTPAMRVLYGVSCASCCSARRLKGPKPVSKAHLQGRTSPCQITISVFSRRVSSLPPAPQYVAIPTPAPLGSLSLAQQLLYCKPAFPSPSQVLLLLSNKYEFRRRRLVTCSASFRGAGLRSLGGFRLCVSSTLAARCTFSSACSQCVRAMR